MCKIIKKYMLLWVAEILLFLLLLATCFIKEKMIFSCHEIDLNNSNGNYISSDFQVMPGVYQVRVYGAKVESEAMLVNAMSEEASFRGLKCNGAVVFKNQEYVDFEIYVSEKLDKVSLSCTQRAGTASIENIEVYRTNWGNRMLCFGFVCASIFLNGMLLFRNAILNNRVTPAKQMVFWGLLGGILIAYFPYMTDYFSGAADIGFHWLRIEGLKETLLQGNQFPVRVQSYWLYDHGYAVSAFYGDTFLMIPVLFRVLGFSIMDAYKMFIFLVMVATALIAYYSFKQCVSNIYAALFGSLIYLLAPYRIYNFYNRGAVGEFLGMTFLPLVICGMYRLYTEEVSASKYIYAKWPLIIGLSCIIQSHILSTEMVLIVLVGVAVILWKKTFRKETFVQLLQATLLFLLINAWFWVPLLQMLIGDQYRLSMILSNGIQYMGTWFGEVFQLYPSRKGLYIGAYEAEAFQIGIASLIMLLIVFAVLWYKKFREKSILWKNKYDKTVLFWSVLICLCWFLSTRYFPWDSLAEIPVLGSLATSLQFPTRLFALVSVLCSVEASFFYLWFKEEYKMRLLEGKISKWWRKSVFSGLIILAVLSSIYHVNDIAIGNGPIWLYTAENMGSISLVNGEYLLEGTQTEDYYFHSPIAEDGLEWEDYNKEGTSVQLYVDNATNEEKYLELPLIGYIGYDVNCEENLQEIPYISEERGNHGDLKIIVPSGYAGYLEVSYRGLFSFRIAEIVSALTLILVMVYHICRRKIWKKENITI